ncbi:hypothetical protein LshimejAT787_0303660 [Lyophyllum shimeji]|uniref:Uncharacterized protein n=1 Tax=Lyophyllum shimeji TaxID=47721 RepID=A0A9P3PIJ2_LYOSH|nr:hypothetical protein LshimejAT787_0303660 [Lyophyllum shimeji]
MDRRRIGIPGAASQATEAIAEAQQEHFFIVGWLESKKLLHAGGEVLPALAPPSSGLGLEPRSLPGIPEAIKLTKALDVLRSFGSLTHSSSRELFDSPIPHLEGVEVVVLVRPLQLLVDRRVGQVGPLLPGAARPPIAARLP